MYLCRMAHVACVGCALCVIMCDVSCNIVCGTPGGLFGGDLGGLMVSVKIVTVCHCMPCMARMVAL